MPKIHSYPAMTSVDGADVIPIDDQSASWETKSLSLTKLKEWLQSLTGWVTASMRTQVAGMGNFSPSANGTIAVTGLGFTPKSIIFVVSTNTADAASSSLNAGIAVGMATSSSLRRYIGATTRSANGGGVKIVGTKAFGITTIAAGGGSQNLSFEGDLTSMDADGFTVTISSWIASANVMWMAFA